jgi:hypothetical protein
LALENEQVQQTADSYIQALANIADKQKNVIGYVFAINGEINSADIYASNDLFRKLWPKLLKANAIEAIAELKQDQKFEEATAENVDSFLAGADDGSLTEKDLTARVQLVSREDEKNAFYETRDRANKGTWIHRNYIKK